MSEEQKESSVLFSLQELFSLEQERIKQEEEDKRRRAEAAARAEEETRRQAIEEEQARLRSDEEKRRIEEQRKREETARLDAMRQAEIEKARVAAEENARLEAMRAQQAHAIELTKLTQDKHKKRLVFGIVGAVSVLVIGLSIGGWVLYKSSQEAEAQRIAMAAQQKAADEAMTKLRAELDKQDKQVGDLIAKLSASQDEASKAKLQAELAEVQKQREATAGALKSGGKKTGSTGGPKPACTCTLGDPLCGCIP